MRKNGAVATNKGLTLWLLAGLLQANSAFADVAPPDRCNQEGAYCANAGGVGAQSGMPGICRPDQCQRGGPNGTIYYDCLTCVVEPDAGQGGGDGTGTDESCNCWVVRPSREQSVAGLMLLLGVLALGWSRRKGGA